MLFTSKVNETISGDVLLTPGRLYEEMCHGDNGISIALCLLLPKYWDFSHRISVIKDHFKHGGGGEVGDQIRKLRPCSLLNTLLKVIFFFRKMRDKLIYYLRFNKFKNL